jgi:fengycin family lipopeptide synthetase D
MSLITILRNAALLNTAGITFISSGEVAEYISYRDLYGKALVVLEALQQKGIQPGDEVVIQTSDNRHLLFVFWACILGKIIPVPLATGTSSMQKLKLLKVWPCLSNPYWVSSKEEVAVIGPACLAAGMEKAYHQMEGRMMLVEELLSGDREGIVYEATAQDIAYIQFSSGSTGYPKGVTLTHNNLLCNSADIIKSLAITEADVLLSWMPLTHDMGLIGFHLAGITRNIHTVSMTTSLFIRRPLLWMEETTRYRATVLFTPNSGFQYFLDGCEEDRIYAWNLSCVRLIVNGAEPISASLCSRFTDALKPYGLYEHAITTAYGLAEASVAVTVMPVGTPIQCYFVDRNHINFGNTIQELSKENRTAVGFVDVGYPVASCSIRICNNEGHVLAESMIGHIQVKGENITNGYYNNPEATKGVFDDDQWLKTGDLGFMRHGRLVITGRTKNLIIINGQNYYPQDIEQVITAAGIAKLGKVVACGMKEEVYNKEALIVFVLYKGDIRNFIPLVKAIKDCVMRNIGIAVDQVIPLKKFPKTTSGKIQYYLLREQYLKGAFNSDIAFISELLFHDTQLTVEGAGITDTDSLVKMARMIWGSDEIEADTSLIDIGISSLMATQFANKIYQRIGKRISFEAIFRNNTLTELCRFINAVPATNHLPALPNAEKKRAIELSIQQKRIWAECQIHATSSAYNIPIVYALKGNLDIQLLQQSFRDLIRRYEMLRTVFRLNENGLEQKIHDYEEHLFACRYIDLRKMADAEGKAADICFESINAPFQLNTPSQFRVVLIHISEREYLMVFVIHHILVDGWSLTILLSELCRGYNSLRKGDSFLLSEPASFSNYCAWQLELQKTGIFERDKQYWLNELNNLPVPVGLSMQEKLLSGNNHVKTNCYNYSFDEQSLSHLKGLAGRYETTSFVIIMALLNTLLYRYTNQKDIITGFDVSGRVLEELEQLVGYTLNTLCLRVPIDGECSFDKVVGIVKEKVTLALQHQLLPFEQVIEEKQEPGTMYGNTLFKILVLFQDFFEKYAELNLDGCEAVLQSTYIQDGFVDILLEFKQYKHTLNITVQYNIAKYGQREIRQLVMHFHQLLKEAAGNSTGKISLYDFLTNYEKDMLLPQATKHPEIMRIGMPVHIIFQWRAAVTPDKIAVCANDRTITYKQLNDHTNVIAQTIIDTWQIMPGDRIGFMVSRNEKIIIAMLAILKASAAYVAIDPETPLHRCTQIIKDSGVKCMITDDVCMEVMSECADQVFLLDLDSGFLNSSGSNNLAFTGSMNSLAYVIYTSGSTGMPKGVMIQHQSLCHYVQHFIQYFDITKSDIFIQQSSVAFDTLVEEVFPALCTSAKIVIAPGGGRDVEGLLSLIEAHQVTILTTTPLVLREINSCVDSSMASLRCIISGGDFLHASCIDRLFGLVDIYNTYGPAETTVCAAYKKVTDLQEAASIGRPIYGYDILILDENRQLMPYGKTGEICIEGGLATGYLNLPGLTAERFIQHPFDTGKRMYRSGDYGYWKDNGDIELVGRIDNEVKIRGHRLDPAEIEKTACEYGEINTVAVVPSGKNEYLVAFLTVKAGFSADKFRIILSKHLPSYMIPSKIEVIEKMPVTVNGKVDRQLLKEKAKILKTELRQHRWPVTGQEHKLLEIMKAVLHLDSISTDSNFFECGCNSIKAHQVTNKIYQAEGIEISMSEMFTHPTIQQLGVLLTQKIAHNAAYSIIEVE